MKMWIILLIGTFSFFSSSSQSLFDKYYGTCQSDASLGSVELSNKDLIFISSYDEDGYQNKLQIIRTDSLGNLIWAKRILDVELMGYPLVKRYLNNYITMCKCFVNSQYGIAIIEFNDSGNIIRTKVTYNGFHSIGRFAITKDNGIIITGQSSNKGLAVIKVDSLFNIEWAKTSLLIPIWPGSEGEDVIQTIDSGYAISGAFPDTTITSIRINQAIIRIDKSGNIMWKKYYPCNTQYYYKYPWHPSRIIEMPNKEIIVGYSSLIGGGNPALLRVDSSGSVISHTVYNVPYGSPFCDMIKISDSTLLILGSYSTTGFLNNQIIVLKISVTGSLMYAKGFFKFYQQYPKSCLKLANGNVVISGLTYNGYGSFPSQYNNFLIFTIDSSGNSVGSSQNIAIAKTIIPVSTKDIIPTSTFTLNFTDLFLHDSLIEYTLDSTSCPNLGFNEFYIGAENIEVFPNPLSNGYMHINFVGLPTNTIYNVDIRNSLSELIYTNRLNSTIKDNLLYIDNLANGIYFLRIYNEHECFTKKLVYLEN